MGEFELIARVFAPLAADGAAILRKQERDLRALLPQVTRTITIGGHAVPVANLPPTLASDAGHILSRNAPFAAVYSDGNEFRKVSLRSNQHGQDVSAIASLYGGGGHRNAAAFRIAIEDVPAMERGEFSLRYVSNRD